MLSFLGKPCCFLFDDQFLKVQCVSSISHGSATIPWWTRVDTEELDQAKW